MQQRSFILKGIVAGTVLLFTLAFSGCARQKSAEVVTPRPEMPFPKTEFEPQFQEANPEEELSQSEVKALAQAAQAMEEPQMALPPDLEFSTASDVEQILFSRQGDLLKKSFAEQQEEIVRRYVLFAKLASDAAKHVAQYRPYERESFTGELFSAISPVAIRFRVAATYGDGMRWPPQGGIRSEKYTLPKGPPTSVIGTFSGTFWTGREHLRIQPSNGSSQHPVDLIPFPVYNGRNFLSDLQSPREQVGVESSLVYWFKKLKQSEFQAPYPYKTEYAYRTYAQRLRLGVLLLSPAASHFMKSLNPNLARAVSSAFFGFPNDKR